MKPSTHALFRARSKTLSLPWGLGKFGLHAAGAVSLGMWTESVPLIVNHATGTVWSENRERKLSCLLCYCIQTWEIHTSKSVDDISNSSFLIPTVWTRSEEAPGGDEAYLKRCHGGSSVSSEESLFLENLRRPYSSILTIITHSDVQT